MTETAPKYPLATAILSAVLLALALVSSLLFNNLNHTYLGVAGFAFLFFIGLVLWQGRWLPWSKTLAPLVLLLLFWLWTGISALFGKVDYVGLITFLTFAALPLTAWAVVALAWTQRFSGATLSFLVVTVSVLAVYACVQFFWFETRPTATFLNRNNFAAFQIPVILLAMVGTLNSRFSIPARWLCGLTMVLLSFMVGLIGSRGALLSLIVGSLMTLSAMLYLSWSRKSAAAVLLLMLASLVAANLAGSGNLGKRVLSVSDPMSAGKDRFAIWEGALNLAQDSPWYGFGPGTYFLTYPQYRLDSDRSTGFYVHNDYLQLWAEAGWPAVALLGSGALLAFYFTLAFLSHQRARAIDRALAFALISGIAAVMAHSLLTFNLYLLPILIELGLLFGLLAVLTRERPSLAGSMPKPGNRLPIMLRLILIVALIIPGAELTRLIKGTYHFDASIKAIKNGESLKGIDQLSAAVDWWPDVDLYHYTLAWQKIQQASRSFGGPRKQLLSEALSDLEQAQALNPYRPQPHVIRAMLFKLYPEFAPTNDNLAAAEQELRLAMDKDPFYLDARFRLARLLLEQNRLDEGLAILEAGLGKHYETNNLSLNYYRLTAEMRRIMGDAEGYKELLEEVEKVGRRMERKRELSDAPTQRMRGIL
jgi:O-antigen ligase